MGGVSVCAFVFVMVCVFVSVAVTVSVFVFVFVFVAVFVFVCVTVSRYGVGQIRLKCGQPDPHIGATSIAAVLQMCSPDVFLNLSYCASLDGNPGVHTRFSAGAGV